MNKFVRFAPAAFLTFAQFTLLASNAVADDEAAPAPPFIQDAPDPSQWTVKVEYPPDSPQASTADTAGKEILVEKSGGLVHMKRTDPSGETLTTWIADDLVMERRSEWPTGYLISRPAESAIPAFDIPKLGPDTFIRTEPVGGVKCHYHECTRAAVPMETANPDDHDPQKTLVWIDARTRLPVRVIENGSIQTTYNYRFSTYSGQLTLPPEFQERLRLWKERPAAKGN